MSNQIAAAANLLRAGGTVAFPTETVYGLGAELSSPSAIRQIFEIKGRPVDHPLIVHFAEIAQLHHWAREVPEAAWNLAKHFWPGPLTLILPRSDHVPLSVTGGQNTVGLRIPDHPVALALLQTLRPGSALAAPSANRFGRVSPTTATHVREELGQTVDMILDGGTCKIGLESTIVSFCGNNASVLRPGGISLTALETVLKSGITLASKSIVRVPGTLASHYAPVTPLEVVRTNHLWQHALELEARGLRIAVIAWSISNPAHQTTKNIFRHSMPQESEAYGNQLYATLRQFDHEGFDRLLIEAPPDNPAWLAITDRLQRASNGRLHK